MSSDPSSSEPTDSAGGLSALELEKQQLRELNQKPAIPRFLGYVKLSGPGWLQSALTLGGGSLASGLYLGVLTGYSLLWLQPLAMILGVIMLASLSYLTLSTGERTFRAINYHVSPVLGWGWLIGSMMANMVWALPQYSLATAAIKQNLMPEVFGSMEGNTANYILVPIILVISTAITWSYGSGHWGVRLYERMLKITVALVVLCFMLVVGRMVVAGELILSDLFAGFIPSPGSLTEPSPEYQALLAEIEVANQPYWREYILNQQFDIAMAAFATAVGINMTFLLAYSTLGRNWGKEHRPLSIFDLSTGMFIPFLLATTCVVVSAGNRFHAQPFRNLLETVNGTLEEGQDPASDKVVGAYKKLLNERVAADIKADDSVDSSAWLPKEWDSQVQARMATDTISDAEKYLASTLVKRDSFDLSRSLEPLFGGKLFADIIFGIGVLGMAMSTISLLMLVSGFCVCEALNVPSTGWTFRLGTLAAATGALGPFFWTEAAPYLAVPTSVFGLVLLPIAYASFFFLMNSKSYMKEELPTGTKKLLWNILMLCSTLTAIVASTYAIWDKAGWMGIAGLTLFVTAAVMTWRKR
ncbi:Natural resistance-associated macrophage protein [Polystyrenella longa]|uniref:Natural resistance-associated macrophage protein n=1 Tax=Polystyrenella longa TaxID=2528007 RepID=A0A518CLZ6_9PLAN|nr:divalent metal cation transporter [Polystyrenella longa]QDU80242.1 Natural resistance-associated macrophage protein [Polystyrenella longa]